MFTTPIALDITNFFIFRCRNWLVTQWYCCIYHIHLKLHQFETGYHMFTFSQYLGFALTTWEFHFWSKVHLQLQNMNASTYYLQDWASQIWTCLSLTWRQCDTQITGPHLETVWYTDHWAPSQSSWLGRSGVRPENLHLQCLQVSKQCWSRD